MAVEITSEPKQVLLPCYSLGQTRNKAFFGRSDIIELMDNVLLPSQPVMEGLEFDPEPTQVPMPLRTFAIYGMGGMGKTDIAIEFIHSRKMKFDAIFWVNSASTTKLQSGFSEIALKLGLVDEEEARNDDLDAIRDIVKGWLVNPTRTLGSDPPEQDSDIDWLIVFDNADDPDLLYDFWPAGGAGSILITSRNPLAGQANFGDITGIDLPPMSADDAGNFLQMTSHRVTEPNSLDKCAMIVDRLGRLPLAIVQMANVIRNKHLSLDEFIEYYDHDAKRFQEAPIPGLTKQQTIASIWNIESLPPPAVALLQVLSMLDADMIPEDILVTGAPDADLDNFPKDKVGYFEAREALIKSSLISRNIELSFLKLHRLVQDVVRQKLAAEEYRLVYNAAVTLVTAVWPFLDSSNLNQVERLRKVQRYFPHVASFKFLLERKTPSHLKAHIRISALFNEAAW